MSDDRGLGDLNWLPADRSAAEESMYRSSDAPAAEDASAETTQSEETSADQRKQTTRKRASKNARNRTSGTASMKARKPASRKGGQRTVTQAAVNEAPPPPGRQREARVQFNHRILMDRHEVLEGYKATHGATWQAIVDQMVDEYLTRRGLLEPGGDE